MRRSLHVLALASALAPLPVLAQDTPAPAADRDNAARVVDEIAACRQIADNAQRLACFDRTAGALVAARDRRDIVVVDRQEVRRTRRSLFCFTLPRIRLFGGGDGDRDEPKAEQIREITSTVTRVARVDYENVRVTLADNSQWETTQGTRGTPPRQGESVRITRAALGSYLASFNNRISLRVKRVG